MTSLVRDLSDGVRLIQLMVSATAVILLRNISIMTFFYTGNNGYDHDAFLSY